MPTGIELSAGIVVGAAKPIDAKYGPYASTAAALADISSATRYKGLTVGIESAGAVTEYWFRDGVADANFVEKTTAGSGGGTGVDALITFVDNTPLLNTINIVNGSISSWTQQNTWLLLNGIWSDEGYWNDGSPI